MVKGWDAVENVGYYDLGLPTSVLVSIIVLVFVNYGII